ncbi:MAG: hypothetical protein ABIV48_09405 [Pyrinomonadaceae bacterium]
MLVSSPNVRYSSIDRTRLACSGVTVLLMVIFNSLISIIGPCYALDGCLHIPITGTIAYALDELAYLSYFSIFPLGAVLGRREFRKVIRDQKPAASRG